MPPRTLPLTLAGAARAARRSSSDSKATPF